MTSQSKRDLILKTAKELFAEKGYYSTTIDEVAERAGVAKGSIYTYFKSKHDLFVKTIIEDVEEIIRRIESQVVNIESIEGKIRKGVELYLDYFESNLPFFKVLFLERRVLVKESDGEEEECFRGLYHKFVNLLSGALERAIKKGEIRSLNPKVLAIGMIGGIDRILFTYLYGDNEKDLSPREAVGTLLEAIFNGITTKSKEEET